MIPVSPKSDCNHYFQTFLGYILGRNEHRLELKFYGIIWLGTGQFPAFGARSPYQ